MKKLVTIGATAMMGFTSLGGLQLISHAAEGNNSPVAGAIQTFSKDLLGDVTAHAAETGVVNIPDANLKKVLNEAIDPARSADQDITKDEAGQEQAKFKTITPNIPDTVKDLTGLSAFKNLRGVAIVASADLKITDEKDLSDVKWTVINGSGLTQELFEKIVNNLPANMSNSHPYFTKGTLTDLTPLQSRTTWTNYSLGNQSVTESKQTAVHGNLVLNVKDIKNIDGSTPTITPANGGVYNSTAKTITWNGLDAATTELSYSWSGKNTFAGKVTVPVEVTDKQPDQQGNTDVTFETTVQPGEPGWYGVVTPTIAFTDANKASELDASVKIVNATDQTTNYNGDKSVNVKVKSTNGFDLKDGAKEAVAYSITNKDGQAIVKNTTEQDLGTVTGEKAAGDGSNVIASKATLKGTAKESGKYVDTLNYHFIEQ